LVESSLTDINLAPLQADEGAPEAWLMFNEEAREGLQNLKPGDKLIVLTWLHPR
jgi:tRNA (Thr-GGU) A37 N-methylase